MLLVAASGCARPATGANAATPQTENRIEQALQTGDVVTALGVAQDYERRVPGPEAWSYMGRALWRLGELQRAEGFHRRSAGDAHPEGQLGLARALAARGEFEAALELADPSLAVGSMSSRAASFVGSISWRLLRPAAAAEQFERGAATATAETARRLNRWAHLLREAPAGAWAWRGTAGVVPTALENGSTWAEVRIGGHAARLRVDPYAWRSSITPTFADRAGLSTESQIDALHVQLGGIEAMVPMRRSPEGEGDGVLGFDVLSRVRWMWTPTSGYLLVGVAGDEAEEVLFQRDLERTHWVHARVIIDGLDAQLVVFPRVGARPVAATLAFVGANTVATHTAVAVTEREALALGETVELLTRVGGWSDSVAYRVGPEMMAARQVPIATPVVFGAEFTSGWTWRWSPSARQLAMIRPR
ncbi:MAG: hypothetical protein GKS06_05130 [Acidobacteria bacterium]|nr:hypothetical protein [Acidobacteriota bacterium]